MSRGYSLEQWVEWIEQQRTSGLSVAAFCRSVGVSENAFYLRRKKLSARDVSEAAGRKPSPFVSLKVTEHKSSGVRIEWPCGAVMNSSDQDSIRTVVTAMRDRGASS